MKPTILLCPECGGVLTRDVHATVETWVVPIRPLRTDEPQAARVPCILEHCTVCEWTREVWRQR